MDAETHRKHLNAVDKQVAEKPLKPAVRVLQKFHSSSYAKLPEQGSFILDNPREPELDF